MLHDEVGFQIVLSLLHAAMLVLHHEWCQLVVLVVFVSDFAPDTLIIVLFVVFAGRAAWPVLSEFGLGRWLDLAVAVVFNLSP